MNPTMLSPHFRLKELTFSKTATRKGLVNLPNEEQTTNLVRLCRELEKVRELLHNRPIFITSGFRCPELNEAVGGKHGSAHTKGCAADWFCPSVKTGEAYETVARAVRDGELTVDQLIYEKGHSGSWIHLAIPEARGELLEYQQGREPPYQPYSFPEDQQ